MPYSPTNRTQPTTKETEVPNIPLTPTAAERLTKCEATLNTLTMQYRALLNSTEMLSENLQALAESAETLARNGEYLVRFVQAQKDRTDALEARWKANMEQAVQLIMDWDAEPTFEDYMDLDQSRTDLTLLHRVEDEVTT
jgi:hypothetical protein